MPRKKATHAYRTGIDDGGTECDCGRKFDDEAAWRTHYENETTEDERVELEDRAPLDDETGSG